MLWCDGRRRFDLPPGARVEVRRGALPVSLARVRGLAEGLPAGGEFTDRWWPSSGSRSRAGAADPGGRPANFATFLRKYLLARPVQVTLEPNT